MKKSNVTSFPKEKVTNESKHVQNSLSPREIVSELDRFVVGQNKAKRAVAIARINNREDAFTKICLVFSIKTAIENGQIKLSQQPV